MVQSAPDEFYQRIEGRLSDFDSFVLPGPGWRFAVDRLQREFSQEVADDFERLQGVLAAAPEEYNPYKLLVLVGARHEVRQKGLRRWCMVTEIQSGASVSRAKTSLQDKGFVRTETVSADIGRPPERLLLTEKGKQRYESIMSEPSYKDQADQDSVALSEA